jgi:alkylation response protein AidB-like acyl-CoA dehydrogenase
MTTHILRLTVNMYNYIYVISIIYTITMMIMIFELTISIIITCDVDKFGTDSQKAEFLPGLCSMDKTASYCLTEPGM